MHVNELHVNELHFSEPRKTYSTQDVARIVKRIREGDRPVIEVQPRSGGQGFTITHGQLAMLGYQNCGFLNVPVVVLKGTCIFPRCTSGVSAKHLCRLHFPMAHRFPRCTEHGRILAADGFCVDAEGKQHLPVVVFVSLECIVVSSGARAIVQDEAFQQLVDSIRENGVVTPIAVTKISMNQEGLPTYAIVDGLHRAKAARQLGHKEIPAHMRTPSKPEDMAKALRRLLDSNGGDVDELAEKLGQSPEWIRKLLREYPSKKGKTPAQRGLVRCLEPKCKIWIVPKEPLYLRDGGFRYFCKKHKSLGNYDQFLLHDREGNAIWVTASMTVLKISEMESSHILNAICKFERDSRRRSEITGIAYTDALGEYKRYPLLVAELKQRDTCKLCKDGIIVTWKHNLDGLGDPVDTPEMRYCTCQRGAVRAAAAAVAEQAKKQGITVTMGVVFAMVTALLIGGACAKGMDFIHAVCAQLKAMGLM